jgi:hypothetical protein
MMILGGLFAPVALMVAALIMESLQTRMLPHQGEGKRL